MKKLLLPSIIFILSNQFLISQSNTFPPSGDVGIGTLAPSATIHMEKTGSTVSFLLNRTDGTFFRSAVGTAGGAFFFGDTGRFSIAPSTGISNNTTDFANALTFYGSGHAQFPGQIIIGALSPGDNSKFSVNGRVRSEEVKVVANIEAPDYVFKSDYKLLTIDDLKEFIRGNGHLPEIPSAKEFEQNGILLGEMSFNLLKKIEELTLYIFELNDDIVNLKQEIQVLKNN
jgi:hypothetical protein